MCMFWKLWYLKYSFHLLIKVAIVILASILLVYHSSSRCSYFIRKCHHHRSNPHLLHPQRQPLCTLLPVWQVDFSQDGRSHRPHSHLGLAIHCFCYNHPAFERHHHPGQVPLAWASVTWRFLWEYQRFVYQQVRRHPCLRTVSCLLRLYTLWRSHHLEPH